MLDTLPYLQQIDFPPLVRETLTTLQVNLGYRCNQQCLHCHVAANPKRSEMMARETIDAIIDAADRLQVKQFDLTGGAPELNPHFRYLVQAARARGMQVIDRCNLTILFEPGQETLAPFLAENRVEVVASMPCYLEENVDAQRGENAFNRSVAGLQRLNEQGYGDPETGLILNLVYNPQGPSLPPDQANLEADYTRVLAEQYGIRFNQLLALANLPVQRFGSTLLSSGAFESYMDLLQRNHQPDNLKSVMCRSLISIDWQGYLYDCDFNQMLKLSLGDGMPIHIGGLTLEMVSERPIAVAGHCFGCTAGQGSSCGGALS